MTASLHIYFHDDTWDEIKLGDGNGLYWKPTMQGLMIRQEGVRGCRTVYPWHAIRKYHVETEAGLRDQERRAEERAERKRKRLLDAQFGRYGRPVGGRRNVQQPAHRGLRRPEGVPPLGPE